MGSTITVSLAWQARHSEVFQGMFEIPQPDTECEMFDGCKVVRMYDVPEELSNLIIALYDGPYVLVNSD